MEQYDTVFLARSNDGKIAIWSAMVAIGPEYAFADSRIFIYYLVKCKDLPYRNIIVWEENNVEGNVEMVVQIIIINSASFEEGDGKNYSPHFLLCQNGYRSSF